MPAGHGGQSGGATAHGSCSAFRRTDSAGRTHRRLGARRAVAALVSPGHSGPAARVPSCLTRACHRPVVWQHEIPDSGISHWNTGSSPRSDTEEGDISPVFAALEHAAGDFTTLGKNPLLEYSSPPSDTFSNFFSVTRPFAVAYPLRGCALFRDVHIVTGIACLEVKNTDCRHSLQHSDFHWPEVPAESSG